MELTKLAINDDGSWLTLEHPVTGEALDIQIKLVSVDSDIYRKKLREQQNRRLKKGFKGLTADELEKETIELLVACTLDWRNIEYEGVALECNPANIRKVYTEFPWIRDQVEIFINDRANFLKN